MNQVSRIQNRVEWPVHKTVMESLKKEAMDSLGGSLCTPLFISVGRAVDNPVYDELRTRIALGVLG